MSEPPPDLRYSRQVVANDGVAGGVSGQQGDGVIGELRQLVVSGKQAGWE